jgi:putative oxidoreductase
VTQTSKLIIPGLGGLYAAIEEWTLPLLRIVTGLWLLPHGWSKLSGGLQGTADFFQSAGFSPGLFWAWMVALTEFFGGLFLAAGFLTRLVTIPIIIFLLAAASFHSSNGFMWSNGGLEYPLFWAVSAFIFLIRGGGKASVDRMIGKEF